jgi:hypothetical protein
VVEWQVAGRFTHLTIGDGTKTNSIEAFALAMALLEIAKTVNAGAEPKADRQSAANGISSIVTPISHPPISAPEIRDPPGARALDERRVRCGSRRWC